MPIRWIPDGRSIVEIVLLTLGWLATGVLIVREFWEARTPDLQLIGIWAALTFSLTALNPLDLIQGVRQRGDRQ